MFKDLKNKNIILTGGLGFLGKQIVNAFNDEGSNIIILDNKKKVSSEKFEHFNCNISNEKSLSLISKKILRKFKKIDILINNAASNHDIKSKIKGILKVHGANKIQDLQVDQLPKVKTDLEALS